MTTREVIDQYFERLKRKSDWDALLAPDIVFVSYTSPNKRVEGKEAYLAATKRFYGSIGSVEVREMLIDGDRACALTRYEIQPPNGAPFPSDVAEIFTVSGGRIASFGIYFDTAPYPK